MDPTEGKGESQGPEAARAAQPARRPKGRAPPDKAPPDKPPPAKPDKPAAAKADKPAPAKSEKAPPAKPDKPPPAKPDKPAPAKSEKAPPAKADKPAAAKAEKAPPAKPDRPPPARGKPADDPSPIDRLFSHIPVVRRLSSREALDALKRPADRDAVHPALLEFQMQVATDFSLDEDARTRLFLEMMCVQVRDEPFPEGDAPGRPTILQLIMRTMEFLYPSDRRMTPVGVGSAVRFMKEKIHDLERAILGQSLKAEQERRAQLLSAIQHYLEDRILEVSDFLERSLARSILEGDVILTYGWSPIICNALKRAATEDRVRFRLIVVDSRPNFDAGRLIDAIGTWPGSDEIDVRYTLMSGLSYVMPEVKKVLIEPCGILSNNAALTPIGTAMIAMVAHEFGVPVVMPCPSHRFVEKVSIDGLARNEILARDFLARRPEAEGVRADYLALVYDVTPGQYVDIVMCEVGNLPVTSISAMIAMIQDAYRADVDRPA